MIVSPVIIGEMTCKKQKKWTQELYFIFYFSFYFDSYLENISFNIVDNITGNFPSCNCPSMNMRLFSAIQYNNLNVLLKVY